MLAFCHDEEYNSFYPHEEESIMQTVYACRDKIHELRAMLDNCAWSPLERRDLERELAEQRQLFYELNILYVVWMHAIACAIMTVGMLIAVNISRDYLTTYQNTFASVWFYGWLMATLFFLFVGS